MQIFRNRPLALAAWISALFAVVSLSFSAKVFKLLLITSFVGLLLSVCIPLFRFRNLGMLRRNLHIILCLLGIFCTLFANFLFFHIRYEKVQKLLDGNTTVEGLVLKRSLSAPYASTFDIEIVSVNGEKTKIKAAMETSYTSALQSGDRFFASVTRRTFENEQEKQSCLSNGQLAVIVCQDPHDCEVFAHDAKDLRVMLHKWNLALSTRLYYAIGGEEGALATALLFGNRSFLSADTALHFRRSGISHLLALSGLHVSILCGFAEMLLRKCLRIPRIARVVIIPFLLILYLAVTGFAPSTIRAVCMVLALYLSFILRMEYDSFTSLSATLIGILLVTPYAVMDISMWLSFVAASSIVIFLSPLSRLGERWGHKRHKFVQWLVRMAVGLITAVCVGISANLALMWLMAVVFGEISLLSFPMTLLLSFPTTLALILSVPILLFPSFSMLPSAVRTVGSWMLFGARIGSERSGALLPCSKLDAIVILLILTVILILLAVLKIKRKQLFFLPLVISLIACVWTVGQIKLSDEGISMTYLQVGEGSICIFSEKGVAVAVDATDGRAPHVRTIDFALQRERCTELSDLFLTRYYNMEAAYLRSVCSYFRLKSLHLPIPQNDEDRMIAKRLEEEAALHGTQVLYGISKTGLNGLTLESLAYAPSEGSGRDGILFSSVCEGKRICMINMSTAYSEIASEAQSRIGSCDVLIVNRAGLTAENNGVFEYRSERPLMLLLEDETLKNLMPPHTEEINVITKGEYIRILLRKS